MSVLVPNSIISFIDALLVSVLVTSAVSDGVWGKVFNVITYPAILLGILLNSLVQGSTGTITSLIGFGVGFGPFFSFFARGLIGGGDVKLLAAIGALKGYPFILDAIFWSFLVAALMALTLMIWRRLFAVTLHELLGMTLSLVIPGAGPLTPPQRHNTLPFAIAAAFGSVIALILSHHGYAALGG
jgi:prepilin peptidase CpaA